MNGTKAVCRILSAVLLIAPGITRAAEIPRSVAEALNNLHHTQAQAADWDGFQSYSSVTYLRVGKSRTLGTFREKVTLVLTERTPTLLKFDSVLANGERNRWLPASISEPELAAAKALRFGDEEVFVGQRKFRAEVYGFSYDRLGRSYEHRYWLAPGVPDGVLRHRSWTKIDPTFTSESNMKVTDLNVELKAGTRTVQGYCFETTEGARGGKFTHHRICKSSDVPGAVVTGESTETEGSQETAHVVETVESFTVVR